MIKKYISNYCSLVGFLEFVKKGFWIETFHNKKSLI